MERIVSARPCPYALVELWRREIDGVAKSIIRRVATIEGRHAALLMAERALAAGASPDVVRAELDRALPEDES